MFHVDILCDMSTFYVICRQFVLLNADVPHKMSMTYMSLYANVRYHSFPCLEDL